MFQKRHYEWLANFCACNALPARERFAFACELRDALIDSERNFNRKLFEDASGITVHLHDMQERERNLASSL